MSNSRQAPLVKGELSIQIYNTSIKQIITAFLISENKSKKKANYFLKKILLNPIGKDFKIIYLKDIFILIKLYLVLNLELDYINNFFLKRLNYFKL